MSWTVSFSSSIKVFITTNHRIGAHTRTNQTIPYGTALLGDAFPGTSCQAKIAPSLRDISQQAQTDTSTAPRPEFQVGVLKA
jgi:hypothetical protein